MLMSIGCLGHLMSYLCARNVIYAPTGPKFEFSMLLGHHHVQPRALISLMLTMNLSENA